MLLVQMGGWSQEKELSEYVDGIAVLPSGAVIMLLLLVLWGEIHVDSNSSANAFYSLETRGPG